MRKFYALCFLLALLLPGNALRLTAQESQEASSQGDSTAAKALPTDLFVGLLVVQPGNTLYTSYGHCALRLTCPSKGLDVSFTYGLDDNISQFVAFFTGKGLGSYSRLYTTEYLKEYQQEGREVKEYPLNLSLDEKRAIWALLDQEANHGGMLRYDYLHTNCSSMCIYAVAQSLKDEHIEYGKLNQAVTGTYRNFVRSISADQPWTNFVWQSLLGAEGEETGQTEDKLAPLLLVDAWQNATIVSNAGTSSRPVFQHQPQTVVKGTATYPRNPFTPTVCFGLLLILTLTITLSEHWAWGRKIAHGYDIALFALYTVVGFLLLYMSEFSGLSSAHHSLYALACNPVPLVLWLCFRNKSFYAKFFWIYLLVLAALIVCTPLHPQLDIEHALIMGTLALRCISRLHLVRF